jgi:hypothetical protein
MEVIKEITIPYNFQEQFFWKDCSLNFIRKTFDELLVKSIESLIKTGLSNPKKYITVDIGFQVFNEGTKSCNNVGWHVDGVGNDYLMWIEGDFRTEFQSAEDTPKLTPTDRNKLLEFNKSIEGSAAAGTEIPNATLIKYTSQDIHRGRVATSAGKRFFIRICSSDYLTPKNRKLK